MQIDKNDSKQISQKPRIDSILEKFYQKRSIIDNIISFFTNNKKTAFSQVTPSQYFFDSEKAFDNFNPHIIINKLLAD